MEPIRGLLADPTSCHEFTKDVSVHWYPAGAAVCYCGKNTRADTTEDAPQPEG